MGRDTYLYVSMYSISTLQEHVYELSSLSPSIAHIWTDLIYNFCRLLEACRKQLENPT